VCASDGSYEVFGEGVVGGSIASNPRGGGGFGWDSVFVPSDGGGRTYAEMSEDEKNLISHRRKAFIALRHALEKA
jgi:XTP/dITP diphosphohydrolase